MERVITFFVKHKGEFAIIIFFIAILVMMNLIYPLQEKEITVLSSNAEAGQIKFQRFRDGIVEFKHRENSNNREYSVTIYEKLPVFDMYKKGGSFILAGSGQGHTAVTNFFGRTTVIEVGEMKLNEVDYGYKWDNIITLFIAANLILLGKVCYKKRRKYYE